MPIRLFLSMLTFLVLTHSPARSQPTLPKSVDKVLKGVSPDALRAHVAYLADDRLKGRLPGTPEYLMAVEYVESQYRRLGLEPAGENGTFRQRVVIRTATPVPEESGLSYTDGKADLTLEYGSDYAIQGDFNAADHRFEAPLVFAGYGISVPGLGYDDYAGLDVRGKVVLVLDRVPADRFGSTETAHLGSLRTKVDMAYAHGAAGVLALPPPAVGSNFSGFAARITRGSRGIILPGGRADGRGVNPYPSVKLVGALSWTGLGKLLGKPELSNRELAARLYTGTEPIHFPGTLRARVRTTYEEIESYNVIGKIPGADPVLRDEYVVHTAHLDHVGAGRPVEGDSIYNGAHDNASGVASLLEIARTYTRLKKDRPRRSVLFVMVTAEEMGLLGSFYFARNPTVPKEKIVANVNTDMPTILAPLLGIVPLGAEHSSLMDVVQRAAGHLGLEVMEDHMPEQVRFVRSDQYSFVLQGIPALHIKYGLKAAPGFDLDGLIRDFTENHYHKPSDELNDSFDFGAGQTYVRLNFLISYLTATNAERPRWREESIFAPAPIKKAAFIILDGIPADVLEKVATPTLDEIARVGGYTRAYVGGETGAYNETPTISAPGYMTLLTGAWANKHNVWGNDKQSPNYHYWNLFRILEHTDPGRKSAVFSTWLDNRTVLIGEGAPGAGDFRLDYAFDGFELDTVRFPHDEDRRYILAIDELVSDEAGRYIAEHGPDLSWVYLEYTDDMGHKFGDSETFYESVKLADRQVKKIWDAVKKRQAMGEDWMLVVTTDHGRDSDSGKNHGGQSTRERTTWIVTNAGELNARFTAGQPAMTDIAPSILSHLGIVAPETVRKEMDGASFLGPVSFDHFRVDLTGNTLNASWTPVTAGGEARLSIAFSNNFQKGGHDEYTLLGKAPVADGRLQIVLTPDQMARYAESGFLKVVLQAPLNESNRWAPAAGPAE